MSQVFF